jgi:sulfur carrier protein ThiS
MAIKVCIGELGSQAKEVILEDNSTVKQALKAAEVETENMSISVNNEIATLETTLEDSDLVTITTADIKQGL